MLRQKKKKNTKLNNDWLQVCTEKKFQKWIHKDNDFSISFNRRDLISVSGRGDNPHWYTCVCVQSESLSKVSAVIIIPPSNLQHDRVVTPTLIARVPHRDSTWSFFFHSPCPFEKALNFCQQSFTFCRDDDEMHDETNGETTQKFHFSKLSKLLKSTPTTYNFNLNLILKTTAI